MQQTESEVFQRVRDHAQAVAKLVGADAADHETGVATSPCLGPDGQPAPGGRFYAQGNYQLPVAGDHAAVLARLRDTWQEQGWSIKEFRMFNEGEGTVSAENPADGIQVAAESSRPPTALALLVITPCYAPAAG